MENETETIHTCPKCNQQVGEMDAFCGNCAYPLKGSQEEIKEHGLKEWEKDFNAQDNIKKLKNGTTTLFVVAGLCAVGGLIIYAITQEVIDLIAYLIVAAIYVGLGFASKKYPFPSILIGLILYILLMILGIVEDPSNIVKGVIMKILVLVYLGRALKGAYDIRNNTP